MMQVTYSNRIEELFLHFKNNILQTDDNPFVLRLVVVPSVATKAWLTEKLSDCAEMGTALGFKIVLLDEALYTLKKLCSPPSTKKVPNRMELALAIEQEIHHIKALHDFVLKGAKNGRRRTHLAKTLSHLFYKYGRFSPDCWTGWQKELSDLVYTNNNWITPHEFFSTPLTPPLRDVKIDLFALSFMSPLEFNFVRDVSRQMVELRPVNLWIHSPCLHFWSDLTSEKEKNSLLLHALRRASVEKVDSLEELLEDTNPLLANLGKLGREMTILIDNEVDVCESAYIANKETLQLGEYDHFNESAELVSEPATLLSCIQTDLLYLRNPLTTPPLAIEDDSIECHKLSSKLREVEWAKDLILRLYAEKKTDIVVLAPDIDDYAPYIERVFAETGPQLAYSLSGQKTAVNHPHVKLLDFYLDKLRGKASFACLLQLAPFAGFSPEEVDEMEEWIDKFNLQKPEIDPLIYGFMNGSIEISDLELVAKWDGFLRLLEAATPPEQLKLHEWVDWLEKLPLVCDEEVLLKLRRLTNLETSFFSFKEHFTTLLLSLRESDPYHNLGQVRFSSLRDASALPTQATILLGMDENAFPRREELCSFDLLKTPINQMKIPSQVDIDRHLFLNLLLSTRKNLMILWSAGEAPSIVVSELLEYIKKGFITKNLVYRHPEKSHDPLYFTENSALRTFSQEFWKSAAIKPQAPPPFFPVWAPSSNEAINPIGLRGLVSLMKKPIEFYLKGLGLTSKREFSKEEESYTLNALDLWKIKNQHLNGKPPLFTPNTLFDKLKCRKEQALLDDIKLFMDENNLTKVTALPVVPSAELPIHGIIPYVAEGGIVSLGSDKVEDIIRVLPEFLLASAKDPKKNKIYCLKSLKTVELSLDAKALLKSLLIYAARAKERPYPFFPKCVKTLVKGSSKELAPLLKVIDPACDPEEIAKAYQHEAEALFGPFLKAFKEAS